MKKILVLGVCALFLLLIFSNTAVADIKKPSPKLFDIEVTDHNPDGTKDTRIVKLTLKEVNNLRKDILNAESMEEKHSIFRNYNLVSKDIKLETLKQGMLKRAEEIGVKCDIELKKIRLKFPIVISFFDKVDVIYLGGTSARVGTSPITNLINRLLKTKLPGIDLVDMCTGLFGIVNTRGLYVKHTLVSLFGLAGLVGFVGTSVKLPFLMHIFNGYSAMTFGIGTGVHIKTVITPTPTE